MISGSETVTSALAFSEKQWYVKAQDLYKDQTFPATTQTLNLIKRELFKIRSGK